MGNSANKELECLRLCATISGNASVGGDRGLTVIRTRIKRLEQALLRSKVSTI
jgi:hypothetical protein